MAPAIMTIIALGLAAGLAAFFPLTMVALYVSILPVPLFFLWVGRDVEAPMDRILAVDAARAKQSRPVAQPKALDRAA